MDIVSFVLKCFFYLVTEITRWDIPNLLKVVNYYFLFLWNENDMYSELVLKCILN